MSPAEASRLASVNPDYHNQELFSAISRGQYPVWDFSIQVMEPEQAEKYGRAVFDITKVWPHKDCPLIPVGKMMLNKNVSIL
jgi:catalase